MRNFLTAAALCLAGAQCLAGQDSVPPVAPPQETVTQSASQTPPAAALPAEGSAISAETPVQTNPQNRVDKRVFGVIPNNRTTSGTAPYEPITAGHKIVIAFKDSFDWPSYVTGAAFAGIYQLANSNPSFGQGAEGYFHRFATSSSDQIVGNLMTEGFVPALFHQDPRYFMLGPSGGTRKHRLWHALISTSVAPMDSGKRTFNFSEWGGNAFAAAVGNAYYPDGRSVEDNVQRWLTSIGTDTLSNVMKEFWPDVKNWWKHKRQPKDAASIAGFRP